MSTRLLEPEVIGPPDCPILLRWTLLDLGRRGVKLMLHHFPPNADDRDMHDHPRPFWTLVLRGTYDDLVPCRRCKGLGFHYVWSAERAGTHRCMRCEASGVVLGERMRPGMLRLRLAKHTHRTRVGENGCWTLVLMGPLRRDWGFRRGQRWWFWKDYEAEFGFAMRCDDLDKEYRNQ